jgi:hypothetical protein
MMDASALSWETSRGASTPFPDGEPEAPQAFSRRIPWGLFDPEDNSYEAMAALPSSHDYHWFARPLPSGQVAMAGQDNTAIDIFHTPTARSASGSTHTRNPNEGQSPQVLGVPRALE